MSQIVWTPLPTRYEQTVAYVSTFVSPRLDTTTLSGTQFENWPNTLVGAQFSLVIDPLSASLPVYPINQPDAALWSQVFDSKSVEPFAFKDNSSRPLWSYPVAATRDYIESIYAYVASKSATSLPMMDLSQQNPLTAAVTQIDQVNRARITTRQQVYAQARDIGTNDAWRAAVQTEKNAIANVTDPGARALWLAKRFYDRPGSKSAKDDKGYVLPHPRPNTPSFDFHKKLALLADHPYLLRRLGLVLDFKVDLAASGLPPSGFVRLNVVWQLPHPATDVTPRTAYEVVGTRFSPRTALAVSDIADAMLALEDGARFAAIQGEVDGDAHKIVDFASNMARLVKAMNQESSTGEAAPLPQGLPARRTTGFMVVRTGREQVIGDRFLANKVLNQSIDTNAPHDLYAEDLVRGYRIDVRPTTGLSWASLHRRRTTYVYGTSSPTTLVTDNVDEGYIKAASATSDPDPSGPVDMYLHEAVFGWEGWSLAAARPGRRLLSVYASEEASIDRPDTPPSPDFPLTAIPRVEPGSLTPLRFGVSYRFRARTVDLAGNSLLYNDPAADATVHATAPQTYKRYEPIPPPTLVLRWPITEGESVEHLVIRSGEGKDAEGYAAWLNSTYADAGFPQKVYRGFTDRHIAPPKTTQAMAEAHGDFDGAFKGSADRTMFFRLGTREEGSFADKRIASLTADDGYVDGNPNEAEIITPPEVPQDLRRAAVGGPETSSLTERRGDALAPGEYVVCGVQNAQLPYLPDSMAAGSCFYDPTTGSDTVSASFTGTWPELQPFRLRLQQGTSVGVDASAARQYSITLPPATILKLRYGTVPVASRIGHMAYWVDYSPSADALAGRHWMLTPWREVTLVHAVPRPIDPPAADIKLSRNIHDTFVDHEGVLQVHGRSTASVDIEASWLETQDLPSRPLPEDGKSSPAAPQSAHAYQVPVEYGVDKVQYARRHELHDTRHRIVTYKPIATTRYKEYFPAALIADPANITRAGFAPGPRTDKSFSIPSSARPAVPKVLYVVPSFKWETSDGGKTSTRRGGGLRIYLDRPWYSTGEGELLAALLYNAGTGMTGDPAARAHVSHWGRDPIWAGGVDLDIAKAFKNAKVAAQAVPFADLPGVCDLAAFSVEFHPARKLWFCDIEMDPTGAYFPFVSLALARYQPDSVAGVELSPMVRADFSQLAPDRTLTVDAQAQSAVVEVTGVVAPNSADQVPAVAYLATTGIQNSNMPPPASHHFVAYVQERTPGSIGDLGWATQGREVELGGRVALDTGIAYYRATVPLPAKVNSGAERRMVVEEREFYDVDPVDSQYPGGPAVNYRIVYIDTVTVE
jgi:hypothetical protein